MCIVHGTYIVDVDGVEVAKFGFSSQESIPRLRRIEVRM